VLQHDRNVAGLGQNRSQRDRSGARDQGSAVGGRGDVLDLHLGQPRPQRRRRLGRGLARPPRVQRVPDRAGARSAFEDAAQVGAAQIGVVRLHQQPYAAAIRQPQTAGQRRGRRGRLTGARHQAQRGRAEVVRELQMGRQVARALGQLHVGGQPDQPQSLVRQQPPGGPPCRRGDAGVDRLVGRTPQLDGVDPVPVQQRGHPVEGQTGAAEGGDREDHRARHPVGAKLP